MDLRKKAGSGEQWTDEMHASFLNRMEEAFVNNVLVGGGAGGGGGGGAAPVNSRLDRYLPDSATESTRDNQSSGRAAPLTDSGRRHRATRTHTTAKIKRAHTNYNSSQDQVVPAFERTTNNAHKEKKGGNR